MSEEKKLADMSSAELEAHIKKAEEKHRNEMRYLRALQKATAAQGR